MRTTLDIEDDILEAAAEMARRDGTTIGHIITELARRGLIIQGRKTVFRSGVPVIPSRGDSISPDHIRRLMDQEGL